MCVDFAVYAIAILPPALVYQEYRRKLFNFEANIYITPYMYIQIYIYYTLYTFVELFLEALISLMDVSI
jgi:hypothetical protein